MKTVPITQEKEEEKNPAKSNDEVKQWESRFLLYYPLRIKTD